MGLTPLEGLVMGTRSGDIDAGAVTSVSYTHLIIPQRIFAIHVSMQYI